MTSSISSMNSPINWGIDENKTVANSKELVNLSKTLQFLEKNPNWMQQHAHEQLAKDIANKAFTTKFPEYLKPQVDRLQRALESVPELVPLVTIRIGSKEERIPKETLMLRSELFKSSLTNTDTGKNNLIELNTQDTSKEAIRLFLEFLRYGKVVDFGEEIQDLYHLAASYNVVGLQAQIEAYLEENLDEDNLADIYEFALAVNSDYLQNSCFRMTLKNPEIREKIESSQDEHDSQLKRLLDSVKNWDHLAASYKVVGLQAPIEAYLEENLDENSLADIYEFALSTNSDFVKNSCFRIVLKNPEIREKIESSKEESDTNLKELLNLVQTWEKEIEHRCRVLNIKKSDRSGELKTTKSIEYKEDVKLEIANNLTPDMLKIIQEIEQRAGIASLEIKSISETDVQNLIDIKVYPRQLVIEESTLKELPEPWQKSVQVLSCSKCENLTGLKVPNAHTIYVGRCTNLANIEAPNAQRVFAEECINLTKVELPQALGVIISNSINLKSLKAPLATSVEIGGCINLEEFEAQKLEKVNVSGFTHLKNLAVPNATEVKVAGCTSLTSLKAPNAEKIIATGCTSLIRLKTNATFWVNVSECPSLLSVEAPYVETFIGRNCLSLKALKLQNTYQIEVDGCINLESLEASKALIIYAADCGNLISINAPKADVRR